MMNKTPWLIKRNPALFYYSDRLLPTNLNRSFLQLHGSYDFAGHHYVQYSDGHRKLTRETDGKYIFGI